MKSSNAIIKVTSTIVIIAILSMASVAGAETSGSSNQASATMAAKAEVGERPPVFFNFMLSGSILYEDPDNRLTTRDANGLATPGLLLRLGGVIKENHLLGGIFQANWRATKEVIDSQGEDEEWGAVANFYIGPEYRYLTNFGLYAGGSLGFSYTFVDNQVGSGDSPDCNSYACLEEHMEESEDSGIPGIGARAVVGYEYRFKRTLAINVEGFGGLFHGEDQNGNKMTTPTWGLAFGVGI